MKRIILVFIILFPVLTLLVWFYWGYTQHVNTLPPATNANITTNAPAKP